MGQEGLCIPILIQCLLILPLGILPRSLEESLPGTKVRKLCPCGFGEAVEERLINEENLRGLGHRQHQLLTVDHALLHKLRHKFRNLIIGEIIPVIHQDRAVRHGQHRLRIGNEHVRQCLCPRFSLGCRQHLLMYIVRIGDAGDLHPDVFFLPDGLIEFVNEIIQRRVIRLTVNMPERHRHQLLAAAARQQNGSQHYQQGAEKAYS